MIAVSLDDITRYPPLDTVMMRLLSGVHQTRTASEIGREYNTEKYLSLLNAIDHELIAGDPRSVRLAELNRDPQTAWCWVDQGGFFSGTLLEAQDLFDVWIAQSVLKRIGPAKTIVDLGCGYGYHFRLTAPQRPDLSFWGGDVSENGLKLGRRLFRAQPNVRFATADLRSERLGVLDDLHGPVFVTTCYAIQQIPRAEHVIDLLSQNRDKISGVTFLEPTYDTSDRTLIANLRRAYAELCGYNMDLLTTLKARSDIEILSLDIDVSGPNPLCPTSLIHWTFK